jgi:hypothetical protein
MTSTPGPTSDRSAALTARAAIAAVVATVITFAVATYFTNEANSKERELTVAQQELTRQGQITDRYSTAVDQLGHDQLDVRLGGIYALERILRESETDQPIIAEVLFAFIRDHAPTDCRKSPDHPATDVQAALTVLGRRDPKRDQNKVRSDLNRACLIGADLTGANLPRVNLAFTDLTCARLPGVHLEHANLTLTQLGDADLTDATLTDATLTDTVLNDAFLTRANLTGATLNHVNLTRAQVTRQQLAAAKRLIATKPPIGSPHPSPCAK